MDGFVSSISSPTSSPSINHSSVTEAPEKSINSPDAMALIAALCLLPIISTTAGGSIFNPNSAVFDQWISDNVNDFHFRNDEIASGINPDLDPQLRSADKNPRFITVRKDGKGKFTTISDAVDSIPQKNKRRVVIRIGPGVYREKVKIGRSKPFLTFFGERNAMPTITFAGTAAEYGTLDSASVAVESHYFVASNIIFEVIISRLMRLGRLY